MKKMYFLSLFLLFGVSNSYAKLKKSKSFSDVVEFSKSEYCQSAKKYIDRFARDARDLTLENSSCKGNTLSYNGTLAYVITPSQKFRVYKSDRCHHAASVIRLLNTRKVDWQTNCHYTESGLGFGGPDSASFTLQAKMKIPSEGAMGKQFSETVTFANSKDCADVQELVDIFSTQSNDFYVEKNFCKNNTLNYKGYLSYRRTPTDSFKIRGMHDECLVYRKLMKRLNSRAVKWNGKCAYTESNLGFGGPSSASFTFKAKFSITQ